MGLNSIQADNIIIITRQLEVRANNLGAKIQGALIDTLRIKDASITDAKIADLSISTAKIQDGAIIDAKIDSLSAEKVTAGTISADRIEADSITAGKLNVSTLSSISANLGTVNAGSVNGITITSSSIKTSNGDDRVSLGSDSSLLFYSGGDLRMWAKNTHIYIYGAGVGFVETAGGGTFRGLLGTSSVTGDVIFGSNNVPLVLLQALGNGNIWLSADEINIWGTWQINGTTKTAIVPTSKGYKALYCVEGAEVWFMDIVEKGKEIDPMFLEVTEGEIKTITNKNGDKLVFRKRTGFGTIRLETKTKEQFIRNNKKWQN